jgi:hypothetical protein
VVKLERAAISSVFVSVVIGSCEWKGQGSDNRAHTCRTALEKGSTPSYHPGMKGSNTDTPGQCRFYLVPPNETGAIILLCMCCFDPTTKSRNVPTCAIWCLTQAQEQCHKVSGPIYNHRLDGYDTCCRSLPRLQVLSTQRNLPVIKHTIVF